VAGVATNTTNDVGGEVALFGAVVFAVSYLAAVLTSLVLVVAQSTVEGCKFAQLVALELVLTFGDGSGLQEIC
jgi:hypothetical protein